MGEERARIPVGIGQGVGRRVLSSKEKGVRFQYG